MQKDKEEMSIGVLDIYGFEIFEVSKIIVTHLKNPRFVTSFIRTETIVNYVKENY